MESPKRAQDMGKSGEPAFICEALLVAWRQVDLATACRVAGPLVRHMPQLGEVHTDCILAGDPPTLKATFTHPLGPQGVRLFSTADPPEIACDISLLAEAPPTAEGFLLDDGRAIVLRWLFSSEMGLTHVHCQAKVAADNPSHQEFQPYRKQCVAAIMGYTLDALDALPEGRSYLMTDPAAVPYLMTCMQIGAAPAQACRYLLKRRTEDPTRDQALMRTLVNLPPELLQGLMSDVEAAGLRGLLLDALFTALERPRAWLEPHLIDRIAAGATAETVVRLRSWMERASAPWIAWWQAAQALEWAGHHSDAVAMACGALEKLPTLMDAIRMLQRDNSEMAQKAVTNAVAWMTEESSPQLGAARRALIAMVGDNQAESLVTEAVHRLRNSTRLARRRSF